MEGKIVSGTRQSFCWSFISPIANTVSMEDKFKVRQCGYHSSPPSGWVFQPLPSDTKATSNIHLTVFWSSAKS